MKVVKYLAAGLISVIVLAMLIVYAGWRLSMPQVEGQVAIPSLGAKVEVLRDSWGVPHIFAQNKKDLYTAMGYVMAQDRLFHMDFLRRVGRGQLAEILGPDLVSTDHFLRVLSVMWPEERAEKTLTGPYRQACEAYAAGVNEFIRTHEWSLPAEFRLLGYRPEPWRATDGLYVNLLMGWSLQTGWLDLTMLKLVDKVGPNMADEAMPTYPGGGPTIVPPGLSGLAELIRDLPDPRRLHPILAKLSAEVGGSNGWVVSGKKTASGRPILCQDPHLSLTTPAIWYEVHLQSPELDVTGVALPGLPGIVIGNNRDVAWGCTNVMLDDMDFFVEKANPANPDEFEYLGQWERARRIPVQIKVKGGDFVTKTIRVTRHGPIINDVRPGLNQVLAMRWTLNDGLGGTEAFMDINHARNWQDFTQALKKYHGPAQNLPYADKDGHVGFYSAGRIPLRANPGEGALPMPGWDGRHEWQGYVPFEKNPHMYDPEQGFAVVANNQTAPDDYPYYISRYFIAKYRAQRITQLVTSKEKQTVDDHRAFQNDVYSTEGAEVTPIIRQAMAGRTDLDQPAREALGILEKWDFQTDVKSVGATVFHVLQLRLVENIFKDEMGPELFDEYMSVADDVVKGFQFVIHHENSRWFDDITTPGIKETRADIIAKSLIQTGAWLREHLGPEPTLWTWGRVHEHRSGHVVFKDVKYLRDWFNIGPFPLGGSKTTVAPAGYDFQKPFLSNHGASTREIIDFGDRKNDLRVLTTGCSGQMGNRFYDNQSLLWRAGQYHPVLMDREAVEAKTVGRLILSPGKMGD